jgi:PiT family inorganic phosphate transporter
VVRWATARRIVTGWVFTLPSAAVVGAIAALLVKLGAAGVVIDTVLGVGFMIAVFVRARPERIDASSLEREVSAAGTAVHRPKKRDRKGAAAS